MEMDDSLSEFFDEAEFADTTLTGDDLFAILESLDGGGGDQILSPMVSPVDETEGPRSKRQKVLGSSQEDQDGPGDQQDGSKGDGQQKISHITVERNRRKQMNEHLSVLRSLMPCFYVKRGDQASIIGGVVDYINELQLVLQSLESKKQRKAYSEGLSPRLAGNTNTSILSPPVLSPRKPPLSPRLSHHFPPISPRTPQPSSPYRIHHSTSPYHSPTTSMEPSGSVIGGFRSAEHTSSVVNDLVANSKSAIADVEVKFSGANVLLKTVSSRIPGQVVKIISALEDLSLEILQVNINTVEETMLNSFTIKIGIECQLSAEELAQQVQQTFC